MCILEQLPEETQQVHIVRGIVEAKRVHVVEVMMDGTHLVMVNRWMDNG
jgi:type II secretory pathway component PulL